MTPLVKPLKTEYRLAQIFALFYEDPYAVFLDSSLQNRYGQYSIIALNPYHTFKLDRNMDSEEIPAERGFIRVLGDYLRSQETANTTKLPIVSGGVGYFSYDYGRTLENIATKHRDALGIPSVILAFYDNFIIEDHSAGETYLVANGKLADPEESLGLLAEKIAGLPIATPQENPAAIGITANFKEEEYLKAVADMVNYIIEGDIYIANMTQGLTIKSDKSPYAAFEKLRAINPSPFGGYLNYQDFQIISASPERFLSLQNGEVTTRPIKGTRKRGANPEEDALLKKELRQSGKDQNELLMIVDLERNDLNRVCIPGSVKVTELFEVETYATVFHLVSTITGILAPQYNAADLLAATFPGGSITGAPKIRAMEIIDALEHSRRNIYTGSLGYIGLDGKMDMNIIIRTALYKDGLYHLGVGGGITYESDPAFEYEETLQKAKAILEALR